MTGVVYTGYPCRLKKSRDNTKRIMKQVALYLISLVFVGLRLLNASESIEGIEYTRIVGTKSLEQQQEQDHLNNIIISESADRMLVVDVVFDLISDNIEKIPNGVRNIRIVRDYDLFFEIIQYSIDGEKATMLPFCRVVNEAHEDVYNWFIPYIKSRLISSYESFCEEYQITSVAIDFHNDPFDLIRLKMIHYCRIQLFNLLLEFPNEWNYYVEHKIAMYQGLMDKFKAAASFPEDVVHAIYQAIILFRNMKRIEEFEYEASREREEEFERLSKFTFEGDFIFSDSGSESFKTANDGDNGDNENESDTQPRETIQEIVSEFVNRIRDAAINSTYELTSEGSSELGESKVPAPRVSNESYDEVVSLSPSDNEDDQPIEQTEQSSEETEDDGIYIIHHNNSPIILSISGSDDDSITISVQDSEYSEIEDGVSVDAFGNLVVNHGVTETTDNLDESDPLVEDRNESVSRNTETDEADNVNWTETLSIAEIVITEPLLMDVTEDAQVEIQEHNNVAVPVDTIVSMEEDDAHVEEPADTMEVESQDNEGEERIEANIVGDSLDDHSENDSVAPSVTYNLIENDQVDHPVNNSLIELIQERGIVEMRNDQEERDSGSGSEVEVEEEKSESSSDEEVELVEDSNRSERVTIADLFTSEKNLDINTESDDSSSNSSSKSSLYDEKGTMRALRRAEKCKNSVTKIVRPAVRKDSSSDSESDSSRESSSSSSSSITTTSLINVPVVTSQLSLKPTSTSSSFNIRNILIVVVTAILIATVIGLGWMMYKRIDLEEEENQ